MIILFRKKRGLCLICFCGYIGNTYFPKPLSAKEEAEAVRRWQAGEEEARNVLIERNLRLVVHLCKKYEQPGIEKDDLVSIGTIGLIKAIDSFSPARKVRLSTYAAKCIENEILMFFRGNKNQRQEMSLYEPLGFDKEGNEVALMDILSTDQNSVTEELEIEYEKKELLDKVSQLDYREKTVLNLRYGLNNEEKLTQKNVARHLGISRSYVSRIEKRALKKLADSFGEE